MLDASDLKRNAYIYVQDAPMMVVDVQFSTPTARGGNTLAKVKLRNLLTGKLVSETFKSSERFNEVDLEQRACSFLYDDGDRWHFMEDESYDQFDFGKEELGDATGYLKEGLEGLKAVLIEGNVVSVSLPNSVELTVTETDPAIKGATAQAQMKAATTETGLIVQVPPYLTTGERIKIDTRDGRFLERVRS